jgi:hypothetical protein
MAKTPWGWYNMIIPQVWSATRDPRASQFRFPNGGLLWPGPGASDFLLVPTALADSFANVATWLSDHDVFLEIGFPMLLQILQDRHNVSISDVELCTTWDYNIRQDLYQFVENGGCSDKNFSVYHPIKLSIGLQRWGEAFDNLTNT